MKVKGLIYFTFLFAFFSHSETLFSQIKKIELKELAISQTMFATFQSHNQKVVSNQYGIFLTYLETEVKKKGTWKLLHSKDGGKTFYVLRSGFNPTRAPGIETDEVGNLYLFHMDQFSLVFNKLTPQDHYKTTKIKKINWARAQKFTTYYDSERKRIYYFNYNFYPLPNFFAFDLSGNLIFSKSLTKKGKNAKIQYPHLTMDGKNLYSAWTTQKDIKGGHIYWDIHFMVSKDGGQNWESLQGKKLETPVLVDNSGPTDLVSLPDENNVHTWLSSMTALNGFLHFFYYAWPDKNREHYVRYDLTNRIQDKNIYPTWKGESISISSMDGFFVKDLDHKNPRLFVVAKTPDQRIAILISYDQGNSWSDYALSDPSISNYSYYSLGGFRTISYDGFLIGTVTLQDFTKNNQHKVLFFKVPVN